MTEKQTLLKRLAEWLQHLFSSHPNASSSATHSSASATPKLALSLKEPVPNPVPSVKTPNAVPQARIDRPPISPKKLGISAPQPHPKSDAFLPPRTTQKTRKKKSARKTARTKKTVSKPKPKPKPVLPKPVPKPAPAPQPAPAPSPKPVPEKKTAQAPVHLAESEYQRLENELKQMYQQKQTEEQTAFEQNPAPKARKVIVEKRIETVSVPPKEESVTKQDIEELKKLIQEKGKGSLDEKQIKQLQDNIGSLLEKKMLSKMEVEQNIRLINPNNAGEGFGKLMGLIAPVSGNSGYSFSTERMNLPETGMGKDKQKKLEGKQKELEKQEVFTQYDKILEIVKERGRISLDDLARELKVDAKTLKEAVDILENGHLIVQEYSAFGPSKVIDVDFARKHPEVK